MFSPMFAAPGFMDTSVGPMPSTHARAVNPVRSHSLSRARHGSAEQGRRPRAASRDGRRTVSGSGSRPLITGRTQPIGPQEHVEWTEALEYCNDRIDGLERSSRLLA